MTSIVIAAHNEADVIGRCLDRLLEAAEPGELDVTVVPNGCTDATAEVARARGVRVVEVRSAGKAAALNLGDQLAEGFPRAYLDADIEVSVADIRALCRPLASRAGSKCGEGVMVAVPQRAIAVAGRPWPVRAYYDINRRLPAYRDGLFGRGLIVLSEEARARFGEFPLMVADDLFLDSLFSSQERCCVSDVVTTVEAPYRTRDLVNRLGRVRRGNSAMRTGGATSAAMPVRRANRLDWFRCVVLPRPRLAPQGAAYVAITLLAAVLAKRSARHDAAWSRPTAEGRGPTPRRAGYADVGESK